MTSSIGSDANQWELSPRTFHSPSNGPFLILCVIFFHHWKVRWPYASAARHINVIVQNGYPKCISWIFHGSHLLDNVWNGYVLDRNWQCINSRSSICSSWGSTAQRCQLPGPGYCRFHQSRRDIHLRRPYLEPIDIPSSKQLRSIRSRRDRSIRHCYERRYWVCSRHPLRTISHLKQPLMHSVSQWT